MSKYQQYLKSDHWRGLKAASKQVYGYCCVICESKNDVHRHHLFYEEHVTDSQKHHIVPLCGLCHDIYHRNAPNAGINDARWRGKPDVIMTNLMETICPHRFLDSKEIMTGKWYKKKLQRLIKRYKKGETDFFENRTERNSKRKEERLLKRKAIRQKRLRKLRKSNCS